MRFIILILFFVVQSKASEVLIIGDSHTVGYFGQALDGELGVTKNVSRFGVVGAKASDWNRDQVCPLGTSCGLGPGYVQPEAFGDSSVSGKPPIEYPGFGSIQKTMNAELIIFGLGTNDSVSSCGSGALTKEISATKKLIGKLKPNQFCIWIGPPTYMQGPVINKCGLNGYNSFVDTLKVGVEEQGCLFVDSRNMRSLDGRSLSLITTVNDCSVLSSSQKRLEADAADKLHFGKASAKYWARCAWIAIKNNCGF